MGSGSSTIGQLTPHISQITLSLCNKWTCSNLCVERLQEATSSPRSSQMLLLPPEIDLTPVSPRILVTPMMESLWIQRQGSSSSVCLRYPSTPLYMTVGSFSTTESTRSQSS